MNGKELVKVASVTMRALVGFAVVVFVFIGVRLDASPAGLPGREVD